MTVYVDEETGEEFSEDDVDWGGYEVASPAPSRSWRDELSDILGGAADFGRKARRNIAASVVDTTVGGLAGWHEAIAENAPWLPFLDAERARRAGQQAHATAEHWKSLSPTDSGSVGDSVVKAASGAAPAVVAMAAGPLAPLKFFLDGGANYPAFKEAGGTPGEAGAAAVEQSLLDSYLFGNLIKVGKAAKTLPGAIGNTFAGLEFFGAGSEANRELVEQALDPKRALNKEEVGRRVGEYLRNSSADNLGVSAILGPLGHASARGGSRRRMRESDELQRALEELPPDTETPLPDKFIPRESDPELQAALDELGAQPLVSGDIISDSAAAREAESLSASSSSSRIRLEKALAQDSLTESGTPLDMSLPLGTTNQGDTILPESLESAQNVPLSSSSANSQISSPSSSRYSPSNSPVDIANDPHFLSRYQSTTNEKGFLQGLLDEVAPGSNSGALTKGLDDAAGKIARKVQSGKDTYDADSLGDLVRGSVIVREPGEAKKLMDAIGARAEIIPSSVEDYFSRLSPLGYEGLQFNIRTPSGNVNEIQIHTPRTKAKSKVTHAYYEKLRASDVPITEREQILARAIGSEFDRRYIAQKDPEGALRLEQEMEEYLPKEARSKSNVYTLDDPPVEVVPLSDLNIRPDLMQFREGASKTGTREDRQLEDQPFEQTKAGQFLVWEPGNAQEHGITDGGVIIGDGHHRYDLATRAKPETVEIRRFREADGFTADDVRLKAAENNLAQGNATVRDQVIYFREAAKKLGREEAKLKGKRLGAKARNAKEIALDGTDTLNSLFVTGKIGEAEAAAIARAAPRDEVAQQIGIDAVREQGMSADKLEDFIEIATRPDLQESLRSGIAPEAQVDLFGSGADPGRAVAAKLADVLGSLKGELSDRIKFNRSLVRADNKGLAEKEQVDIGDAASRSQKAKQYAAEREFVSNILDNTALRNAAIDGIKKGKPVDEILDDVRALIPRGESGAVRLDLLTRPVGVVAKKALDYVAPKVDQLDDAINELKKQGKNTAYLKSQQRPEGEDWLNGVVAGRNVRFGGSFIARQWRDKMSRARVAMSKNPVTKQIWESRGRQDEWEAQTLHKFREQYTQFRDLIDNSKVVNALVAARQESLRRSQNGLPQLVVSDQFLKQQGFSDKEVGAYRAIRNVLDQAHDLQLTTMLDDLQRTVSDPAELAEREKEVRQFMAEKKASNYFPIHRFGDHFVYGENAKGEKWYSLHETAAQAKEAAKNLGATYDNVRFGQVRKVQDAAYENMPHELRFDLARLQKDPTAQPDFPVGGFKGHMLQAKLTPGFEKNLDRNLAEYLDSTIRWAGKTKFGHVQRDMLKQMDPRNPMYQYASDWLNYRQSPGYEGSKLREFIGHYYLGLLNPAAATLNATQSLTITYPELARYSKKPAASMAQAIGMASKVRRDPIGFARKNPQLADAIRDASEKGILSKGMFTPDTTRGLDKPTKWESFKDLSMYLNRKVEESNRLISYIAGYQNAPAGKNPAEFAREFTTRTQFDYSRQDRPKVARGLAAPLYTFKLYGHNYWGNLTDNVRDIVKGKREAADAKKKGDIARAQAAIKTKQDAARVLRRTLGTAWTLGGAMAIPFAREVVGFAALNNMDLKRLLREETDDDMAGLLMYGPPSMIPDLGVQLTGSVAPSEIVPLGKGLGETAVQLIGGAAGDLFLNRTRRAQQAYDTTGDLTRALEEIAPRTVKNLMTANRWAKEGRATDIYGRTIMDDPTSAETLMKGLSFNPSRYAEAQEMAGSVRMLKEEALSESEGLTNKIAVALERGDNERLRELLDEARANGVEVSKARVKARLEENQNPELRALKSVPKRKRKEAWQIIGLYR